MNDVRRKLLILIPALTGGGAERVFSMLLSHLDRSSFELHLAVFQEYGEYMSDIPSDVVVHRLRVRRARYALPRLLRLVWQLKPAVILSTHGHLNITLTLIRPLMPASMRMILREAAVQSAALQGETKHPALFRWLYRRFYRRADAIVCLCDSMIEDMVEHFRVPREKLVRIYNPVDIKRVREFAEQGENPYSGPGPHLVAAGRLTRQKGFDVLLDAFPSVLQCFPNARLAILGQGPLLQELKQQAERLDLTSKVSFLGFCSNPWVYFKHADVFVLPSRYEGFPNVLLEVLALGTPVVASDCPGAVGEVEAIVRRIGLVPPEDSGALAKAIIAACDQPRLRSDRENEASLLPLSAFDLNRIVSEYSSLLGSGSV